MHYLNPNAMLHSWTASVELHNGITLTIWYTAWPSMKSSVKKINWIASDFPRHTIKIL